MRILRLLGRPELAVEPCVPLRFPSAKALELLAFLAYAGGEVRREVVARALWPDAEDRRGLHNLRQTLVYLRKGLDDAGAGDVIAQTRTTMALRPEVETDVARFRECAVGDGERLRRALSLYRAPLLPGVWTEWAEAARDDLSQLHVRALVRLASELVGSAPEEAAELAARAIQVDPLLEAAREARIRALVAMRETAKAREELDRYSRVLQSELGLAPSAKLRELVVGDEPAPEVLAEMGYLTAALSPTERLRLEVSLSPGYEALGQAAKGRRRILAALTQARAASAADRARGLVWASRFCFALDDLAGAQEHASRALEIAGGSPARVLALLAWSRARLWQSDLDGAAEAAGSARRLARRFEDEEGVAEALHLLGSVSFFRQQLPQAARRFAAARRHAERADHPGLMVRTLASLAAIRFRSGDLSRAAADSLRAVREAERRGLRLLAAMATADHGRTLEAQGRLIEAHNRYERSRSILETSEMPRMLGQVLTYLGDLAIVQQDAASAMAHHGRAERLRRVSGDTLGLATNLRGLGKAHALRNDLSSARSCLIASVAAFERSAGPVASASARVPLARVLLELGRPREARDHLERAREAMAPYDDVARRGHVNDGSVDGAVIRDLCRAIQAAEGKNDSADAADCGAL